jgi:hypothetical protein
MIGSSNGHILTLAADGLAPSWLATLSPPILFFFLGALAAAVRSNLRVPPAVTKLLSLYLLWAIGFRGGVHLLEGGLTQQAVVALGLAIGLSLVVPVYSFFVLRMRLDAANAAAVCATYGSISAVTFMTAATVLEQRQIAYGGHMVAAMALMESPAIVIALLLLRRAERADAKAAAATEDAATPGKPATQVGKVKWGTLLHEAFLNGPVILLLGSLAIGLLTGDRGYQAFEPLCTDLFNGVLVFFLLDLGLVAARKLRAMKGQSAFLVGFAIISPLVNAALAIALAHVCGLSEGDSVLLAVLASSASYIAVPAAMRLIIPKANPGLYIPMALGITFPFNISLGIPLYIWVVHALR